MSSTMINTRSDLTTWPTELLTAQLGQARSYRNPAGVRWCARLESELNRRGGGLAGWGLESLQAQLRSMIDIAAASDRPLDDHFYATIDELAAEINKRR